MHSLARRVCMSGRTRRQARVSANLLARIIAQLGTRDIQIVMTVARVRVVSALQLERVHFISVDAPQSRARTRMRVLARLVSWRVLATLPRPFGGCRAASSRLAFAP